MTSGIAPTPHTAAKYHAFPTFYPAATSPTTDDSNGYDNHTLATMTDLRNT